MMVSHIIGARIMFFVVGGEGNNYKMEIMRAKVNQYFSVEKVISVSVI